MLFAAALGVVSIALWQFRTIDYGDKVVRQRIADDPVIQQGLLENDAYQAQLTAIFEELAQDPLVRAQLAADAKLRAEFAKEPEVQARLNENPAVWAAIAADEQIAARMAADPVLIKHWAAARLGGWIPFLPQAQVEATVSVLALVRSRLNRAAASFAVCLVLLILSTLIIRQDPGERYDPDTLWTPGYARLPAHERDANTGPRNLMFWWLAALLLAAGLVLMFR